MKQMDNYHKITEEPLTREERKQLRKGLMFIPIFVLVSGVIFYVMLSAESTGFFFYAAVGMACIFSVGIFFISRVMILDLREGMKNVLQGIITRKESYDRNANASSGAPNWEYFLYFGSHKFAVNKEQYDDYLENDLVEIKQTKRGKTILSHSVLKRNAIQGDLLQEGQEFSKEVETRLALNPFLLKFWSIGYELLLIYG